MKKRQRILGAVVMGVALFLGIYVGGWLLFVKAIMNIINSQGGKIWIELLKIFGGFPMLMSLVYPMWEIGKMIFLEK